MASYGHQGNSCPLKIFSLATMRARGKYAFRITETLNKRLATFLVVFCPSCNMNRKVGFAVFEINIFGFPVALGSEHRDMDHPGFRTLLGKYALRITETLKKRLATFIVVFCPSCNMRPESRTRRSRTSLVFLWHSNFA